MKFIIQAGKERLESNGGLVLGGKILSGLDLDRRVNGIVIDGALEPKITNGDVLRSYLGLLILGRTNYDDRSSTLSKTEALTINDLRKRQVAVPTHFPASANHTFRTLGGMAAPVARIAWYACPVS